MLSQIAPADRPVSCANIICLLRNTAVDCRCGITLCELEPDHPDCEVRVLRGDKEAWLPFARGQEFAKLIADGQIMRSPRAGHLVQEDAPEAVVAAVLDPGTVNEIPCADATMAGATPKL